jgi:hypothetical protein
MAYCMKKKITYLLNGVGELFCEPLLSTWCVEKGEVKRGEICPLDCKIQYANG